jgi:hypothetical protein
VAEADRVDGPVYCRILRGAVPRLSTRRLKLGQMRVLSGGSDVLVVTAGITTEEALRARGALDRQACRCGTCTSTHKTFDAAQIVDHAASVRHASSRWRTTSSPAGSGARWPKRWPRPGWRSGSCGWASGHLCAWRLAALPDAPLLGSMRWPWSGRWSD